MKMRITDENGKEIGYNVVGNLEVNGPIIFREYLNNPEATQASFNGDWFITGDRGFIDSLGQLNLTGRAKDTVIINGINYLPQELEMVLEDIPGAVPSYTVVFPYRPKGSETENICVIYLPTYNPEDVEKRVETNDAIAKAAMLQTGVRPYVIPLDATKLQKTTLGKLSRPKIRASFENGDFQTFQTVNEEVMAQHRRAKYEGPANHTEQLVLGVFQEIFEVNLLQAN
jgi:acyl-CoA synthetase (AMP-forming)/AMP-acid ligase II